MYTTCLIVKHLCAKFGMPMSKSKDDLVQTKIYGENIILILKPNVQVIHRSWMYATHHPMSIHSCTSYNIIMSIDKGAAAHVNISYCDSRSDYFIDCKSVSLCHLFDLILNKWPFLFLYICDMFCFMGWSSKQKYMYLVRWCCGMFLTSLLHILYFMVFFKALYLQHWYMYKIPLYTVHC